MKPGPASRRFDIHPIPLHAKGMKPPPNLPWLKDEDRLDEDDPKTKELRRRQQKWGILLAAAGVAALTTWFVLRGRGSMRKVSTLGLLPAALLALFRHGD